jgi:hypothetical protein
MGKSSANKGFKPLVEAKIAPHFTIRLPSYQEVEFKPLVEAKIAPPVLASQIGK